MTSTEFINKAKLIHGNLYDYTKTNYVGSKKNVEIICLLHGSFSQRATNHLQGKGCIKCSHNKISINKIKSNEIFINNAILSHGNKYDYSLVNYVDSKTKVKIICPIHGIFEQTPNGHLKGNNCDKCGGSCDLTIDEIIKKAKLIHGDKYDYSLTKCVKTNKKIKIICSKHGEFNQILNGHLQGQGCPICKESKGENKIRLYLEENNFKYIHQHKFIECKHKKVLPFDFYLPDYNICIEFNGTQHYKPVKWFGGDKNFETQQLRDKIKMEYCRENNIPLIIIKHNEDVVNKLESNLKTF